MWRGKNVSRGWNSRVVIEGNNFSSLILISPDSTSDFIFLFCMIREAKQSHPFSNIHPS